MRKREDRWRGCATRRDALRRLAGFLAGAPVLRGQQDPFRDHSRIPGMDELVTAFDFEPVAYAKIPRNAYDYTALGADGEFTLRRNRKAFDWVELVPRTAVEASSVNTATEVLGIKMDYPIMVAPSAGHAQLHPDGELATRRGAATASKTPMIVSINASFPIDKIGAAVASPMWYQLYAKETDDGNRGLVEAAQAAGSRAVVLTVDVAYNAYRERSLHDRNLAAPPPGSAGRRRTRAVPQSNPYGISGQTPYLEWALVERLRAYTKVPLLLKGILTAEDARLAVEHGVDGVIVSNHGARYLDYAPSTLEVLPEIVDEVRGRAVVMVDSGFRRGTDIFKALALGAKAVCLGRVPRWGLAADGAPGVQRVLEILQRELVGAMAKAGRPTLASIDRTAVKTDFS